MGGDVTLIGGRYRLIEPVGEGGMGVVWRAQDESLGRQVAVKRVRLAPGLDAAERAALCERALAEARAAAMLRHPSIVAVHDLVVTDGDPAIVMELVHGPSLEQVIRADGPLPPDRAARIGLRVLSALEAAHAAGVLHRDVKPANVLLAGDGRVVLSDFGIATLAGAQPGTPVGTPGYTAPECLLPEQGPGAGPASDLWSLAATVYTAVEGRGPFHRDTAVAAIAAVLTEPPAPSPSPLWPILSAALDKDPARRPRPAELRARLEAAAREPAAAGPPEPADRAEPDRTGVSAPVAAAALAAAALLGAGAVLVPRLATASAAAPAAASPAPSAPPDREAGRFAALPRACSLLTDAQVAKAVPRAAAMPDGNAECRWYATGFPPRDQERALELKLELVEPTPTRAEVPLAADAVDARREEAASRSGTGGSRASPVADLPGVGDEAITWTDTTGRRHPRHEVTIVFRVSNLVAELSLERGVAEDPALRGQAVAAARSVVEALRR